jgi:hypothetical protein
VPVLACHGKDSNYDVMVVLEELASVVVGSGQDARQVAAPRPGDLMAELNVSPARAPKRWESSGRRVRAI